MAAPEGGAAEPLALDIVRPGGGGPLRAYRWHTAASRKLPVVMVHGLGDHGRALPYRLLAEVLVAAGFPLWSCDLQGHGDVAPEARGRTRLPALCDDLHSLLQNLPAPTPIALVGLSMGAVVALSTAARWPQQVAGVVAAALPLGEIRASRASLLAARLLGRVLPRLTVSSGIDLDRVADDADAVRRYRSDPWVHDRIALGLGADLLAAREPLRRLLRQPPCPTLVLHGRLDDIAPWAPESDPALIGAGCAIRVLPSARHNLLLDRAREQALLAITGWLNQRERSLAAGDAD